MTSSLNFDDQDGVLRSITDAPPTHYTVKIESLSLLTKIRWRNMNPENSKLEDTNGNLFSIQMETRARM
ncbi:hypothetical protein M0R45_021266 [Rubus argutus]|uniref:Uncharacterized protein n=1 Tax=Rubus argutus TaxID=59490 RepID=A0AAW1XEF8_RUBAR